MEFKIHDTKTAPQGAREILGKIVDRYGFIPNLAGVIAESPATLNGLLGAIQAFDAREMTLTALEREVVLVAVSARNRCVYCSAAHGMLASMKGLSRPEVKKLQEGKPLDDPRLEALRRFADSLVERRGQVAREEIERFLGAGFTRAQILEVIQGASLKTLTNWINHLAKPPVNDQFSEFIPSWAETAPV